MLKDVSVLQRTAVTVTEYHTESVVGWDGYAQVRDPDTDVVIAEAAVTMGIGSATEVEITFDAAETAGEPGVYPWSCIGVPPAGEPVEILSGRFSLRYNPTVV